MRRTSKARWSWIQLAAIDRVDEFFEAIDADDVERAAALMREADVDAATIGIVLRKIEEGDAEHSSLRR